LGANIRVPHRAQKAAPCWVSLPHWGHLIARRLATSSKRVDAIMMMHGAPRQCRSGSSSPFSNYFCVILGEAKNRGAING
jgi:hypothetical protein